MARDVTLGAKDVSAVVELAARLYSVAQHRPLSKVTIEEFLLYLEGAADARKVQPWLDHLDARKSEEQALPVQPVLVDDHEVVRFRRNHLVEAFYQAASEGRKFDLNDAARTQAFSREDWVQFAQVTGYSLSGFSELSYVTEEDRQRAERRRKLDLGEME